MKKLLLKWIIDIFGNPASMVFAAAVVLPAIGGLVWKWNSWLEERDAKAQAVVEAQYAQQELDRERQAREIYQDAVSRAMDNQKKDAKRIAELTQFSETQKAVINEALNELDKLSGGDVVIPANRQRVLAITLKRVKAETAGDIQAECDGTPTRCAVDRLRNDILRQLR